MRVFRKLALGLLLVVAASLAGATTVMAQARMYGSSHSFYQDLAPYGRWMNYGNYGQVWIPRVEQGFQPYATRGQWVVTEYGNTWVSDYDWGWAPFHYGRWTFDDYYGWIWIPGDEWGPAWVSWRSDNDYYGWAPLGPGVDINININIPLARWIFVPKRYVTSRNIYNYCLPQPRVVNIYNRTTVINNIYVNNNRRYVAGPRRDEIERVTRSRVVVHKIDNSGRPSRAEASNGSLRIYRPEVTSRPGRGNSSAGSSRDRDQYNAADRNQYRDNNDSRSGGQPQRSYPGNGERGTSERSSSDRSSNDRAWNDRSSNDRSSNDRAGSDRSSNDRGANGQRPEYGSPSRGQQNDRGSAASAGSSQRSVPSRASRETGPQRSNPGVSERSSQGSQSPGRSSQSQGQSGRQGSDQGSSRSARPSRGI